MRGAVLRSSAIVVLLVAWQIATVIVDDPVSWPTPAAVLGRFWSQWAANPDAWRDSIAPSMARLLAGWVSAAIVGTALGTVIGLSARARDVLDPVAAFLRAIPPPALLPLFIVLLGIGDGMKVAMIGFGVVWPVLLNTSDGVASVDPLHREAARAYRVGPIRALLRIVLPSAAPQIFTGLRVSLSIAVVLMVISEIVATVNGIGFELVQAQRSFRTIDVWATIVLLGVIGATLNAILAVIEGRVLSWHPRAAVVDS